MRKGIHLLSILLIFALLLGGCGKTTESGNNNSSETTVPENYAYTMLVTINPKIKLYMDENDKILAVEYLNDDAKTVFADSQLIGIVVDDGLAKIVETSIDKGYLKDGKDVTVTLDEVRDDKLKKDELLLSAEATIKNVLTDKSISANVITRIQSEINAPLDNATSTIDSSMKQSTSSTANPSGTQNPSGSTAQESINCTHCNGSGMCSACNGGKKACPACSGTGSETCKNCDENGMQACPNRRDNCVNGKINCQNCQGSGKMTCNACGGNGKDHYDGVSVCNGCGGSGKQTCPNCGGKGYEICKTCNGSGKLKCEVCGGKHSFICTHCKGVGTAMDCPTCNGTFKCIYCNGTGKQ